MDRQRISRRKRILKTGLIEFVGSAIECTVRNLSETGAAIEVVTPLYIPERFTLVIQSEQMRRPCTVVWRNAKRMGIAFT